MHILLDGIHIVPEMKGVGRYTLNTLRELLSLDNSLQVSILSLCEPCRDVFLETDRVRYLKITWRNHIWHGFKTLPAWAIRLRPDVIFIPYETTLGPISRPYGMVCHDIPQKIRDAQNRGCLNAGRIKDRLYHWMDDGLLAKSLRRAKRVFSNSHYVAEWLRKEVRVDGSRLSYAPCAPGADFHQLSQDVDVQTVREKLNSRDGYILTFFTGDARENVGVVPKVYQHVVNGGGKQTLVVAGVRNDARAFVESSLSNFPWHDRIRIIPFLESGKEKELAEIYAAASVYLDPSLHEGFGMQVIEAMACGVPVVCSNRGALPEVTSSAALLVDPEDHLGIASAVEKALTNQGLRDQLRKCGYDRAASFSWKGTAEVIYAGLVEIVNAKEKGRNSSQRVGLCQ
jgi:glycosyltransferase involved in cell wall biosynthesis